MASSIVDICNMSLGYLGADPIISIDDSAHCDTNYDTVRDACLDDRNWTFAMKRVKLGSPSTTSPAFGYTYQFLLPTDVIRVVEVNGNIYDWEKEGRYILTDQVSIEVMYIYRVEDVRQMPPSFVLALSFRLASVIANPITNKPSLSAKYWEMYQAQLFAASSNDGRQGLNRTVRRNVVMNRDRI
jgi:hypothetical protein